EIALDRMGELAVRPGGARRKTSPIEVVVPDLTSIVVNFLVFFAFTIGGCADNLFELHVGITRSRDELVEGLHIGLVVLSIMKPDGSRRDRRFQRCFVIGQGRKLEGRSHGDTPRCTRRQTRTAVDPKGLASTSSVCCDRIERCAPMSQSFC